MLDKSGIQVVQIAAVVMSIGVVLFCLHCFSVSAKSSGIINWHFQGRQAKTNVYSAHDTRRPLIGVHVYLTPKAKEKAYGLRDVFDFVAHDAGTTGDRLFDEVEVPWIRVYHNPIPLGPSDSKRWQGVEPVPRVIDNFAETYRFMLGVTSGSEPHISPDYYYTGHTESEVKALIRSKPSSHDFGEWMAALYGDSSPAVDSNGDGFTFKGDFGFSSSEWETLGTMLPNGHLYEDFLSTLFREYVIGQTIIGVDDIFTSNQTGTVITTRLLSPQYRPVFGTSLRQLKYPSAAVGVTYYTWQGTGQELDDTKAVFDLVQVHPEDKDLSTRGLRLRPPFYEFSPGQHMGSSGEIIGIFGPYSGFGHLVGSLQAECGSFGSPLVVVIEQVRIGDDSYGSDIVRQYDFELKAGEKMDVDVSLEEMDEPYQLRIRCYATDSFLMTVNNSVLLLDFMIHVGDDSRSLIDDYRTAQMFYVFKEKSTVPINIKQSMRAYEPSVTEFRGSYIYQQALRKGIRPVYNEFQSGDLFGNTTANVYRSVFHELQYKPAVINWFCYGGGDPDSPFGWMDIDYLATELAVLKGQLELMSPYEHIERPQPPLAVFLPVAAPLPVGEELAKLEEKLAPQLMLYSPDVLLTEQLDKYEDYENIIIVLGFIDGPTDTFLSDFLNNVPKDKKVLVLCGSSELYCEPGKRTSSSFSRSLKEVLPLSPVGGVFRSLTIDVSKEVQIEADIAGKVEANPNVKHGEWIESAGKLVGWKDSNLMVFAGIPTKGLDSLIQEFFGLSIPDMRSAGDLHILNRDSEAVSPGYYCLDVGQSLRISSNLKAYDIVRRIPVSGVVYGETVVWVFEPTELHALDAGIASVRLLYKDENSISIDVRMPSYEFDGRVDPELVIYSPNVPTVVSEGEKVDTLSLEQEGFYLLPLNKDGQYDISK